MSFVMNSIKCLKNKFIKPSETLQENRRAFNSFCCYCYCWFASVVSHSVWPHGRQPTRLPRPWDSPGKNTGVGCRFLLQCMKVKSESEFTQSCLTLRYPMDCSPPGSSVHGIFQARVLEWGAIAFSEQIKLLHTITGEAACMQLDYKLF